MRVRLANGAVVANCRRSPKEPLAELGVAPGGNQPKTVVIAPPAAARPVVTIAPPPAAASAEPRTRPH